MTFNQSSASPGDSINVATVTSPGSVVLLSVIDKSLTLLADACKSLESGNVSCIISGSVKDRKTEIDRQIYRAQISRPVLLNMFLTCILVTQLCIMSYNTTVWFPSLWISQICRLLRSLTRGSLPGGTQCDAESTDSCCPNSCTEPTRYGVSTLFNVSWRDYNKYENLYIKLYE